MATRFYLTNSTTPYTPATIRGAWDSTTSAIIKYLGPAPGGSAATRGQAEAVTTNNYDVLLGRWVSDGAIAAGNLSGVMSWVIGVLESSASANDFFHIHAYVTQGDSNTPRGTLLTDSIGATEWPTTATGRSELDKALSTVAVQVGDRIVVEIGYQAQNTSSTSFTGTMNYGNTGTVDLPGGNTGVTAGPGWIQFSDPNHCFSTLASTGKNLCPNPAGKVSTAKWSGNANATLTAQSETGFSRNTGIHAVISSTANPAINTPRVPVSVGEQWAVRLEIKGVTTGTYTVWFNITNANGSFLSPNPSQVVTLTSSAQTISPTPATIPANAASITMSIESTAAATSGDVLDITCVRYDQAASLSAYADGDTSGWAWDGTDGLSTSHQLPVTNVALSNAIEHESARALDASKTGLLSEAPELDTARALSASKSATLGSAHEVDTALGATASKTAALPPATSHETARTLTAGKTAALAAATELDTVGGLLASKAGELGQANEVDTAQRLTPGLPPAHEIDTAHSLTASKVLALTPASEVDTAGSLTAARLLALGLSAEVDTAASLTADKTAVLTVAAELDTDRGLLASKAGELDRSSEADTARSLTAAKVGTLGTTSEVSTAHSFTATKAAALGQAGERDTAGELGTETTGALGVAHELSTARAFSTSKVVALGQAVTIAVAATMTGHKNYDLTAAPETDIARELSASKSSSVNLANELDAAHALTAGKVATFSQAPEVDTAGGFSAGATRTLATAQEVNLAREFSLSKNTALGQASTASTARVLIASKIASLVTASERDMADEISRASGVVWPPHGGMPEVRDANAGDPAMAEPSAGSPVVQTAGGGYASARIAGSSGPYVREAAMAGAPST